MELKTKDYEVGDSELIFMVSENNEDAKDALYKKYKPLIEKEINNVKRSAYALKIDLQDLRQEALLGLSNAIYSYDESVGVKFITYATLCIRRKLSNLINKYGAQKNITFSNAYSIDDSTLDSDYIPYLKDVPSKEPLNKIILDETLSEVQEKYDKLTKLEKEVLGMYLYGNSIDDIAKVKDKTKKQIYNILYNARKKIKYKD